MQDFVIGQRWISAAELHLGLGMVIVSARETGSKNMTARICRSWDSANPTV
jgi:hypothetical protein